MTRVKRKRLEIMTEIHQKITIRQRTNQRAYCEVCNLMVQIFSPPQVINNLNLEISQIKRFFSDERIHFVGTTKMICGNSLVNYLL